VPRFLIDVGAPRNVNRIVDQREPGALIFMKWIEGNRSAVAAVASAGHSDGWRKREWAICRFGASLRFKGMEVLMGLPGTSGIGPRSLGSGDDI